MKTQICLLSGEVMPNVIGILFEKPDRVIPLVTRESESQVEVLDRSLVAANAQTALGKAVRVDPFDPTHCLEVLRQVVPAEPTTSVNWTGGTKIMSHAARCVAEEKRCRALYVNTQGSEIIIEDCGSGSVQKQMIVAKDLGINALVHILAAGHTVDGAQDSVQFEKRHQPDPRLVAAAELIMDASAREMAEIHGLAHANQKPFVPRLLSPYKLQKLQEAKLICATADGAFAIEATETLTRPFHTANPQQANAMFLTASYLEVFVWSQLANRGAFDQVAWHVSLNPYRQGKLAEIDVVVEHEARMVVLECKRAIGEDKRLADLIEEQFAMSRKIGRIFGTWILYIHTFRADMGERVKSQEERAKEFGGRLVWRDDLEQLHQLVADQLQRIRPLL